MSYISTISQTRVEAYIQYSKNHFRLVSVNQIHINVKYFGINSYFCWIK